MGFKVGDAVYTISYWSGIERGIIRTVNDGGYRVDWDELGTSGLRVEDAFKTKSEAVAARNQRREEKKQGYRDGVKTREEALAFIFNHCGQFGEYTDCEANDVGEELALKYFSIKL